MAPVRRDRRRLRQRSGGEPRLARGPARRRGRELGAGQVRARSVPTRLFAHAVVRRSAADRNGGERGAAAQYDAARSATTGVYAADDGQCGGARDVVPGPGAHAHAAGSRAVRRRGDARAHRSAARLCIDARAPARGRHAGHLPRRAAGARDRRTDGPRIDGIRRDRPEMSLLLALLLMTGVTAVGGAASAAAARRPTQRAADLIDRIDDLLPQTQCRRCTFDGCRAYATALARGEADVNQCPPGGERTVAALAALLGRP